MGYVNRLVATGSGNCFAVDGGGGVQGDYGKQVGEVEIIIVQFV